jgi:hypothetical protein
VSIVVRAYEKARHAVRYFLLRRLPTCKQIAPLISESLERRLSIRERTLMKLHLFVCVWCEWYLRQLEGVRGASLTRGKEEAPASADAMPDEARERIRRVLRESAK